MNVELAPRPDSCNVGRGPAILIVDDDSAHAEVLSHRLQQQGFLTRLADCGQLALELARRERPQLVVLDLRLPDTDGLTVCQELGDEPRTADVPVIILSGMERPDIVRRCRAAGCRFFVRKPYDPNALLTLIAHALADVDQ